LELFLQAIPLTDEFWDFLIEQAASWGIVVYEQDWLHNEFEGLNATLKSPTLARQWLLQMGNACSNHGLTVQYCMSYSSHILQSLEIQSVTQARISDDYHPGNSQWIIGTTSMFSDALAIRGSKDNYWSNRTEEGRYGNRTEPWPRLQTVSSILSRGPVYVSDEIGFSDVDLVMKTCQKDGTLLQPSRPCKNLDINFLGKSGFNSYTGEISAAKSLIGPFEYTHLLIANAAANSLKPSDLGLQGDFVSFETNSTQDVREFSEAHPISWADNDEFTFELHTIAPVYNKKWVFLGETAKFVSISPDRFKHVEVDENGFTLTAKGTSGESLTVFCMEGLKTLSTTIVFKQDMETLRCGV